MSASFFVITEGALRFGSKSEGKRYESGEGTTKSNNIKFIQMGRGGGTYSFS